MLHRILEPDTAWRAAMLLYGVIHLLDSGFFIVGTLSSKTVSRTQKVAPVIGVCIAVSQLTIGGLGSGVMVEVVYLFTLIWHLVIACMGFANLVFASRN